MLDFRVKNMLGLSLLSFVLSGVHALSMLFLYVYVTRFPYQIIFLSFNSNTASGAGTANPSEKSEFTLIFCDVVLLNL